MSSELTFAGLQPEILLNREWFSEFLEDYAEVLNERVRSGIVQLENIREITSETDPAVVLLTLRHIGFDLPLDFVAHNIQRLAQSLQILVLYHETAGTDNYPRTLQFILGRSVDVTGLYTQDYVDFYAQPYGPLQVDGGNWYKTSHIELGMQFIPGDQRLVVPRGEPLRNRFLDAFYEFAPVNVVVERFYFNIDLNMNLFFTGRLIKQPKRYRDVGVGAMRLVDLEIIGPDTVVEHSTQTFSVRGTFRNGDTPESSSVTVQDDVLAEWSSNKPGLTGFGESTITFGGVNSDTTVNVFAQFRGRSATKAIKVINQLDATAYIEIRGPDEILAATAEDYHVVAMTQDGEETLNVPIRTLSLNGYMEGNALHCYQIAEDGDILLTAEYALPDGERLTATKKVQAVYVDPNVSLVKLRVEGPNEFYEQEEKLYSVIATFSDKSERVVLAYWKSSSSAVMITPDGELTAGMTESDLDITLTARYQHRNVILEAQKTVRLKQRLIEIQSLVIQGQNTVVSDTKNQYICVARFDNGTSATVEAEWSSDRYRIDADGVLDVGSVGSNPVNLTITARVLGRSAIKQLVAVETPVVLQNLLIVGPDNVREGVTGVVRAFAHYSNNRDVMIQPSWSIKGDPKWAKIDSDGKFSFVKPPSGIIEIEAQYRLGGKLYTQTKPVVVIPITRVIKGLLITGPDSVTSDTRIALSATAVYDDGSIQTVQPQWYVESADPLNDPEAMADIVSPGILQGRYVEQDTQVNVIARYFRETAEFLLTVKPRVINSPDKPVSSRIIGPATFYSNERGSYAHMILFDACPAELGVSSDWTIDVPNDVATIDGDGFLWSVNGKSATITVTSTYQCGNYTVVDSVVVNIIGTQGTLQELRIHGPDSLIENSSNVYTAELFKVGDDLTDGKGKQVTDVTWSIVGTTKGVTVNGIGQVFVTSVDASLTFTLKCVYTEGFETIEATKEIGVTKALPIFGTGPVGIRNDPDIAKYLTKSLPTLDDRQRFTLTAGSGEYMYFCYPASLKQAKFIDVATDFEGGWDGASWPDNGDVGEQFGPIAVTRIIQGIPSTWYLYRTDFSGIGTFTYEVTFGQ